MHNTPDYRGVFLRGLGGNSTSLGELQGDAIRNITGNFVVIGGSIAYEGVFHKIDIDIQEVNGEIGDLRHII